jgi:hypothetical protein
MMSLLLHPKLYDFDFFDLKFDHSSYSKNLCKHSQSYSRKTFINKPSHDKRSDILHKFLNKTSGQTWY